MREPRKIPYGSATHQFGELWLPEATAPAAGWPVVTLLHGGFWRAQWSLDLMHPMASALVTDGCAVWNVEYRRVGHDGGGWPGTGDDIADAINSLGDISADAALDLDRHALDLDRHALDLDRHAIVGHSAGGHLTLWSLLSGRITVPIALAVGLAPVVDLIAGWTNGVGNGAISDFLGGAPDEVPTHYAEASPAALAATSTTTTSQVIIQGTADDSVPVDHVRAYVAQIEASPLPLTYDEFEDVGHMEVIEPDHPTWERARTHLLAALRPTIVLTGFMGTGKSTIGAALADELGFGFVDTDAEIEAAHGSIAQIFAEHGEAHFRQLERDAAGTAANQRGVVIATGGGLMLDADNRALLSEAGRVFSLVAEPAEIIKRVGTGDDRPLLAGPDPAGRIAELLAERSAVYESFETVSTDDRLPEAIVAELLDRIRS